MTPLVDLAFWFFVGVAALAVVILAVRLLLKLFVILFVTGVSALVGSVIVSEIDLIFIGLEIREAAINHAAAEGLDVPPKGAWL